MLDNFLRRDNPLSFPPEADPPVAETPRFSHWYLHKSETEQVLILRWRNGSDLPATKQAGVVPLIVRDPTCREGHLTSGGIPNEGRCSHVHGHARSKHFAC